MNKIILIFTLTLLIVLSLSACSVKPFPTRDSLEKAQSIEIVFAEDSLQFTVLKKLDKAEMIDFVEKFKEIPFQKYVGDPPSPHGNCIRIVYESGNYDMIAYFASDYVENGAKKFYWRNCDEKKFNELIEEFLGE